MNLRSSPSTALQYLLHFVEPLHDAGLLTSYCANSGMLTLGLMTIIVEGVDQATRDEINGMSPRFVFAEGAVVHAHEEDERMDSAREICPVAVGELEEAVGWKGEEELSEALKLGVRDQVEHAHAKGLKVFYRVGKDRCVLPFPLVALALQLTRLATSTGSSLRKSRRTCAPRASTTFDRSTRPDTDDRPLVV